MFCASCGHSIEYPQTVCPACGRPVIQQPVQPAAFVQGADRVRRHVQTVGILWIVWALWSMLTWLIALPFLVNAFGGAPPWMHSWQGGPHFGPGFPFGAMPWLPAVLSAIITGRAILAIVTGVALIRRAPWARTLALVTAFLTVIKPVTGTVLSIYTLWVLLPGRSGEEYNQLVRY